MSQFKAVQPELVQLIGECRGRAANHTTFTLASEAGGMRSVNARHLGATLSTVKSITLVVLFTSGSDPIAAKAVAETLSQQGISFVLNAGVYSRARFSLLARTLYCALADGRTVSAAFASTKAALATLRTSAEPEIELLGSGADTKLATSPVGFRVDTTPAKPTSTQEDSERAEADASKVRERQLDAKRERGEYDVFMCYNGADRAAVRQVGIALKRVGLLPWLDEWELTPGVPWQPLLEQRMASIKSAAVFVGPAGIGPWQEQEIGGFLRQFAARRAPVIPVLLHDAPMAPSLPGFLGNFTWVDFRLREPDPMTRLCWGITGIRPTGL